MDRFWQDLKYGVRMLARSPSFTAIAILTLALGIGANTILFSLVNGVLLKPLPYQDPDRLVFFSESTADFDSSSISYPNFLDWQRNNSTFSSIAAYRGQDYTITGAGETERLRVGMVSWNFFPVLGVKMVAGRSFAPEEDRQGGAPVALISGGLWHRKFGSDPGILGKTITMNGTGYTVIGIVPADFRLEVTNFDSMKDAYIPITQNDDPMFYDRGVHPGTRAIGRLKPGVTFAAAKADMDQVGRNLSQAYPDADKGAGIYLSPLKKDIVGDVAPYLWVLLGAVGFVLLIACVNVANLQLARSSARAREFAIRAALGAGQGRVIRQLLTESILLGLAGGAIGLFLAKWGTQAAIGILPDTLPRAEGIGLDGRVLLFTALVSILSGVIFGLAPAMKTARPNIQQTLQESGRGASGARHRAQGIFVVVEMAMALVLLVGAGLMIRSLIDLWRVDPGFNPGGVLDFAVSLAPSYSANASTARAGVTEVERRLLEIPGIESASMSAGSVPMMDDNEIPFWVDGQPKPANQSEMSSTLFYLVGPGYQKAMQIPLKQGRFLSQDDNEHGAPVLVIDESFAREYFPNQNPIGKRIHLGLVGTAPEIVGIVGHIKQWGLDLDGQRSIHAQAYMPFVQIPDKFFSGPLSVQFMTRSQAPPASMAGPIREAIRKMNSDNVMFQIQPMEEIVANSLAARRFSMFLLSIFAALALLLSSLGIYGVLSYLVGQRSREMGIRIALGAQRADVLRLMLGEGMKMALVGVGIGVVAALGLTRLLVKMLFGVSATDPLTFIGVAAVLAGVALAACYIPARRAMRVDPIVALRYE
jgi:predicted permease